VTLADLAEEVLFHPLDDVFDWDAPPGEPAFERPATTPDAIELVAANVGLLVVPQSLARLYHRKDLTYRPITDAPQSSVALSWPEQATTDLVEDFIGIVRGRTVNSTRGRAKAPPDQRQKRSEPKGTRQKSAAKSTSRNPRARTAGGDTRTAGAKQSPKRGRPRRRS
jgi:hypothetical protein